MISSLRWNICVICPSGSLIVLQIYKVLLLILNNLRSSFTLAFSLPFNLIWILIFFINCKIWSYPIEKVARISGIYNWGIRMYMQSSTVYTYISFFSALVSRSHKDATKRATILAMQDWLKFANFRGTGNRRKSV